MADTLIQAVKAPVWRRGVLDYFSFSRKATAISALDGLRGLAILLVLLRHATLPFQKTEAPILPVLGWDAATPLLNGWIGVDLFFVLSGFLIAHHIYALRDRCGGEWPWRAYFAKRALRIVPTYYFVLFIVVAGLMPGYRVAQDVLGVRIGYHLLFLQDYFPSNIVVAFWSLGVEEKFYLLAPFLLLGLGRLRRPRHMVAVLASLIASGILLRAWAAFLNPSVVDYLSFFPVFRSPFHLVADGLLFGVLCAVVLRHRSSFRPLEHGRRPHLIFWAGALVLVWLLCAEPLMATITLVDKIVQPTVIAGAFAAMQLGLLLGGGPRGFFDLFSLFFLARISYSLYLIHLPLLPLSMALAGADAPFSGFCAMFVVISVLAAVVIHYAVEKPFLILKDRF